MAGIADLKARLAEIETEIKNKTEKAYVDLGRAIVAAYESGADSIEVTEEIREILEELTAGAAPRARGKRVTAKAVTARLVDGFGVETEKVNAALEEFEKAKIKKFLPPINAALDDLEAKGTVNAASALAALRAVFKEMGGAISAATPPVSTTTSPAE